MRGVVEKVGTGDCAGQLVEVEGACWPREEFDVDLCWRCGGAPVPGGDELRLPLFVLFGGTEGAGFRAEQGRLGVVDGFAVDSEPLAHLVKSVSLGGGDDAGGVGTYVEQIIAALAGDVDEVPEEGFGGLKVGVV